MACSAVLRHWQGFARIKKYLTVAPTLLSYQDQWDCMTMGKAIKLTQHCHTRAAAAFMCKFYMLPSHVHTCRLPDARDQAIIEHHFLPGSQLQKQC